MKDWDDWDGFDAKKKDGYRRQGLRVASPGNQLLGCDKVDVRQSKDRVNKLEESLFAVSSVEEPGRVEEERERRLALGVVLQEVLGEDLLDGVGILVVETAVRHRTGPAPEHLVMIFPFPSYLITRNTNGHPHKERTRGGSQMFGLCVVLSADYL